jgi:hypothetical protein
MDMTKLIGAPCDYVYVPKIQPTRYTVYTFNDYLFKRSNMFWTIAIFRDTIKYIENICNIITYPADNKRNKEINISMKCPDVITNNKI